VGLIAGEMFVDPMEVEHRSFADGEGRRTP